VEIINIVKLQWFQFPAGVRFDWVKFGTDEVSFVFKAKEAFQPLRSTLVEHYEISGKLFILGLLMTQFYYWNWK